MTVHLPPGPARRADEDPANAGGLFAELVSLSQDR
ncbi:hypothetical protein STAFG_2255 [Streptomyces afghaniensis 772]|uniref:Uncharacterized protein n=1 Tax=Streptomyces afghaniensis 772 TaxID=1283301 RepID=S4MV62_9ACTN|nr:hypothetical protein STAFG_2255 [Streptomyces afghaniensis 772]